MQLKTTVPAFSVQRFLRRAYNNDELHKLLNYFVYLEIVSHLRAIRDFRQKSQNVIYSGPLGLKPSCEASSSRSLSDS